MITVEDFQKIRARLGAQAEDDIQWSESVTAPSDAESFAREAIFVICNSGMKATVAQGIYQRCMKALYAGGAVSDAFGHAGKVSAIERIWREREALAGVPDRGRQAGVLCEPALGWGHHEVPPRKEPGR